MPSFVLALFVALAPPAGVCAADVASMSAGKLLLAGEGARVTAEAPAELRLDLSEAAGARSGVLELALTPERVAPNEPFLVSVTAEAADGAPHVVASVAFFPPPREGETRRFLIDVSELPDAGEARLSVSLVPASDAPIKETRLRVEGLALPE